MGLSELSLVISLFLLAGPSRTLSYVGTKSTCRSPRASPTSDLSYMIPNVVRRSLSQQSRTPSSRLSDRANRVSHVSSTCLFAASSSDDTAFLDDDSITDPFVILGLDTRNPTTDKKEIKRAYKRMAVKYHPDVSVSKDASAAEKKRASDRFAKINWAYQTLSGKGDATSRTAASSTRTSTSKTSSSRWDPPHRRSGPYASSSSSTDWRDFIPNYGTTDDDYDDAGGDSFGAIFSDLFSGAASVAAGGGRGILKDFVEFLEQNVDGYGGEDDDLQDILRTGSVEEVSMELQDTELVVQQLLNKQKSLKEDLAQVQAQKAGATGKYMERLERDERMSELQARQQVVEGYVQKARKRLLKLQTRYKELLMGDDGRRARRGYPYDYGGAAQSDSTDRTRESTSSSRTYSSTSSSSAEQGSWQGESFGSFGRGRGSSRRGRPSSDRTAGASASARRERTTSSTGSSRTRSSSWSGQSQSRTSSAAPSSSPDPPDYNTPPHRRTSSYASREQENKRRLRELKVDDEFDKLKRDLGL